MADYVDRWRCLTRCPLVFRRPTPINLSQDFLSPPHPIGYGGHGRRNSFSAVVLCQLPCCQNRRSNQQHALATFIHERGQRGGTSRNGCVGLPSLSLSLSYFVRLWENFCRGSLLRKVGSSVTMPIPKTQSTILGRVVAPSMGM
jgi:hypothetical protein